MRNTTALTIAISLAVSLAAAAGAAADETSLAGMHEWRKERGIMCFADHFHSGTGEGATKAAAQKAAIKAWQEFTAFEYGTDWAYFKHAGSRGITYAKAANGWSASVEGRPCNFKRRL